MPDQARGRIEASGWAMREEAERATSCAAPATEGPGHPPRHTFEGVGGHGHNIPPPRIFGKIGSCRYWCWCRIFREIFLTGGVV